MMKLISMILMGIMSIVFLYSFLGPMFGLVEFDNNQMTIGLCCLGGAMVFFLFFLINEKDEEIKSLKAVVKHLEDRIDITVRSNSFLNQSDVIDVKSADVLNKLYKQEDIF